MSVSAPVNTASTRKIKFLSRTLPFPTDPSFREYRMIEDLTGVQAQDVMTGNAGVWMLPVLAIVAMMRSNPNASRADLDRILDLGPGDIVLEGFDEPEGETPAVAETTTANPSTGTESTPETPDSNGTPDSPTTSPEQPESPTT